MEFSTTITNKVKKLIALASKNKLMISTAESCTGGLVAAAITSVSGSSEVFSGSFITYHNNAKQKFLGVKKSLLDKHGAVSGSVAKAMAEGALANSRCDLAVAITGIAGPGGGTKEKPVGLVYIAAAKSKRTVVKAYNFKGNRAKVRAQAVDKSIDLLINII